MKEIKVQVTKYQSDFDDTIFSIKEDCEYYDETYHERNFKVNNSMLKKYNKSTWEHFKYEFLHKYAVAYHVGNGADVNIRNNNNVNAYHIAKGFYTGFENKEAMALMESLVE